ncbi:uncharacterized protein LOC129293506 [Prosopis cineraria]|uniref:uncharacterized protein LOC129293506 n=1 Tax=Prosopis cineraria TaxID=364024 RepID=UPI00241079A7|nr:uncharacterized protein LOC129293506 [Prosopis cineraria]
MEAETLSPQPYSPATSPRSHNTYCCKSPEFEFWMVRNPCFPQPNLHSADQLIADGVLLPLHLLPLQPKSQTPELDPPLPEADPQPDPETGPESSPAITGSAMTTVLSASKRWRDMFKKSEKKNTEMNSPEEKDRGKGKKKERKSGGGGSSAELNINIWPFSRSRSAGAPPRLFPGAPVTRRVNSAPCSRSNSAGESKSRKWPSSPGRAGVHLGRSSPVWQVRRSKIQDPNTEKGSKKETTTTHRSKVASTTSAAGAKTRVLSLNVPTCIGYKQHLTCRNDENSDISAAGGSTRSATRTRGRNGGVSGGAGNGTGNSGNFFNFRSIFSKKSVLTSH